MPAAQPSAAARPLLLRARRGALAVALAGAGVAQAAVVVEAAAPPSTVPEPRVERIHLADESVTVDELRVRGVTQRITVTPKNGAAYDIVPPDATRDPTSRSGPGAGSVGRRIWNIFQF